MPICKICGDKFSGQSEICFQCECELRYFVEQRIHSIQVSQGIIDKTSSKEMKKEQAEHILNVLREIEDKYKGARIDPLNTYNKSLHLNNEIQKAEMQLSEINRPEKDMISFCHYCGQPIPPDSAFCPYCGKKISIPVSNSANKLDSNNDDCSNNTSINIPGSAKEPPQKSEEESPKITYTFSSYDPPKEKLGCLPKGLLAICALVLLFALIIGIGGKTKPNPVDQSESASQTQEKKQEQTQINEKVPSEIDKLYNRAGPNAETLVKKHLANPDTAKFTHDKAKFKTNIGKLYNYGNVTYTNSSGQEVTETFKTCLMIFDNNVYPLYLKLGNDVLQDDLDIVNDLGVITSAGDTKYSNLKQGTMILDGELVANWDSDDMLITYAEYAQIENNMTYSEVSQIIGSYGTEASRVSMSGYETVILVWDGKGSVGANANITFQNGYVVGKAQAGLE